MRCKLPCFVTALFCLEMAVARGEAPTVELTRIASPIIFRGDSQTAYRDPLLLYEQGVFWLFFTLNTHDEDGLPYWQTAYSISTNLIDWSRPITITAHNRNLNECSPGAVIKHDGKWLMCLQTYPTPGSSVYGDKTSRVWFIRSDDLKNWGEPELIKFLGPNVSQADMPRMIDPYVMPDRKESGKWWSFCKVEQTGVNMAWSQDLVEWHPAGRAGGGENPCVIVQDNEYVMFHAPANGIGVKRSKDLRTWRDEGVLTLGQADWPWAAGRITAGFVLDGRNIKGVERYLMVFHGSGPEDERSMFHTFASIGLAWSNDLRSWHWPGSDAKK